MTVLYNKEDKARAGAIWAWNGSQSATQRETGIDRKTIRRWIQDKDEHFWKAVDSANEEFEKSLKQKIVGLLNSQLDNIISKGAELTAKESSVIFGILFDKKQLIENKPTSISKAINVEQRLAEVAEGLKKHAGAKPVMPTAEDADERRPN
tara:strand:- start:220 stop:672 length:453 start_codon:yes stop_codon:yes gene_type:complete